MDDRFHAFAAMPRSVTGRNGQCKSGNGGIRTGPSAHRRAKSPPTASRYVAGYTHRVPRPKERTMAVCRIVETNATPEQYDSIFEKLRTSGAPTASRTLH